MRGIWRMLICMLLVLGAGQSVLAKQVVGWVENIRLYPGDVKIKAKIDSGAKTSSLGCECKTTFMRDGKKWLAFTVKDNQGNSVKMEKPIVRTALIRRHFGQSQRRYVIKLGICLGDVYRETEVTVVDRSGFNYSFLVGRSFLEGKFLIDPSRTYLNHPDCKRHR